MSSWGGQWTPELIGDPSNHPSPAVDPRSGAGYGQNYLVHPEGFEMMPPREAFSLFGMTSRGSAGVASDKPPVDWGMVGSIYPHIYGDPEVHAEAAEHGDGSGIGFAANHLAHDRPDDPGAENSSVHDLEFHGYKAVPTEHIDYVRHPPSDPRVQHAIEGYKTNPNAVPPLVLVHRHGVYHVADGHHRAAAASYARVQPRAVVAFSPHPDEPFSDGTRGPFHGAEPTEARTAMPRRQYGEVGDVAGSHVFRGVHGSDPHAAAEATRQGIPGGGDLGPGTYVAERPWLAIQHAQAHHGDTSGVVLHGQIHPAAKVAHEDWAPHHAVGGQALNDWARGEGHDVLTRGGAGSRIHVVLNPSVVTWDPRNYSVAEAREKFDDTWWGKNGDQEPGDKAPENLYKNAFSPFEVTAALGISHEGVFSLFEVTRGSLPHAIANDYRLMHQAPNPGEGNPSWAEHHGVDEDEPVRIYRAAPHDVTKIHPGDWVTTDSEYAHQHARHKTDPSKDWPVMTEEVPAKHLHTDLNDEHEWGYNGPTLHKPDYHHEDIGVVDHDAHHAEREEMAGEDDKRREYRGGAVVLPPEDHAFVHGGAPAHERAHRLLQHVPKYEDGQASFKEHGAADEDPDMASFDAEEKAAEIHTEHRPSTLYVLHEHPEGRGAPRGISWHAGETYRSTEDDPENPTLYDSDFTHHEFNRRHGVRRKFQPPLQRVAEIDWCTHRHLGGCFWPGDNPVPGTVPQRRGNCNWQTAWEQQLCPMSDPGPMAGMYVKGARDSERLPWTLHRTAARDETLLPVKHAGYKGFVEAYQGHHEEMQKMDAVIDGNDPRPTHPDEAPIGHHTPLVNFVTYHVGDNDFWNRHATVQDVPLHHVYATQPFVVKRHLDKYIANPNAQTEHVERYGPSPKADAYHGNQMPMFVRHEGNHFAIEGHHRTAAAMQRGDSHVRGIVYDADQHGWPEVPEDEFPYEGGSRMHRYGRARKVPECDYVYEDQRAADAHALYSHDDGICTATEAKREQHSEPIKRESSTDPEVHLQLTATWADVRNKAKRIRREGGVRILMASSEGVVGEVRGDHNVYETSLTYVPGSARVGYWHCGCKWAAYAWGRSPKYRRFEGRMCFTPGMRVSMADGSHKPIEQVRPGDRVLTHDGIGTVRNLWENHYNGEIIGITRAGSSRKIWATADHGLLANISMRELTGSSSTKAYRERKAVRDKDAWARTEAGQLQAGDWLMGTYPDAVQQTPSVSLDGLHEHVVVREGVGRLETPSSRSARVYVGASLPEFAYTDPFAVLLGYYLAEGSVEHLNVHGVPRIVAWTLGAHEEHYVEEIVGALTALGAGAAKIYRKANRITVKVSNATLGLLLTRLVGTYATKKELHPDLVRAPQEFQETLLRTYLNGDGCESRASTASKELARQLVALGCRIGDYIPREHVATNNRGPNNREPGNPIYYVETAGRYMQGRERLWENFYGSRVTGVERMHYHGPVYNLNVDDQHTYAVEDTVVFNCSHALAMQYEAQSRSAHGREIGLDIDRPDWMKQRTPVVIQHQRDKKLDRTRRAVPPGNMRSVFSRKEAAVETPCQTPGSQYHTNIADHQIDVTVDLPRDLDLTQEQAELIDDNAHNVMELVLAPFFSVWEMPSDMSAMGPEVELVGGPAQHTAAPDPEFHNTVQRAVDRARDEDAEKHADDATYAENYEPLKKSDVPEGHHPGWAFSRNVEGAPPHANLFAELFDAKDEFEHHPPVSLTQYKHVVNREPLHLDDHGNSWRRHYEWTHPDAVVPEFKGWTGPHSATETLREHPTWSQSFDEDGNRRHHMRTHEERLQMTGTDPTESYHDTIMRRNRNLRDQGWGVVSSLWPIDNVRLDLGQTMADGHLQSTAGHVYYHATPRNLDGEREILPPSHTGVEPSFDAEDEADLDRVFMTKTLAGAHAWGRQLAGEGRYRIYRAHPQYEPDEDDTDLYSTEHSVRRGDLVHAPAERRQGHLMIAASVCPECHGAVGLRVQQCPHCGAQLTPTDTPDIHLGTQSSEGQAKTEGFWRVHPNHRPFADWDASSKLWDDEDDEDYSDKEDDAPREGYSAFHSPHQLYHYFSGEEFNRNGKWDLTGDDSHVVHFPGTEVGKGHDDEPLVMPHPAAPEHPSHPESPEMSSPTHQRMTWHEFRSRFGPTNSHAGAKQKGLPGVAGVVLKALDTGRILMLQRGLEDEKDPARGTWEFPGGHIEDGDATSLHAAIREWEEEVGQPFPEGGAVVHTWTSPNGVYQGHVVVIPEERALVMHEGRIIPNPDDPKGDHAEQAVWWSVEHARKNPALRPECKSGTPWSKIEGAGAEWKTAHLALTPGPRFMTEVSQDDEFSWWPLTAGSNTGSPLLDNSLISGIPVDPPPHSNSANPASSGFATSEDPLDWAEPRSTREDLRVTSGVGGDGYWHVAPVSQRENIEHAGIDYTRGSSEYAGQHLPPGNYMFSDPGHAETYKKTRDYPAELWRVDPEHIKRHHELHQDPFHDLEGTLGVPGWHSTSWYTHDPISPHHLKREAVRPHEGYNAWRDRLWSDLRNKQTPVPQTGHLYRVMSDGEMQEGRRKGVFHSRDGQGLFVTDDPDRIGRKGGDYGHQGGTSHIIEIEPSKVNMGERASYYDKNFVEKSVDHVPMHAVTRAWTWNDEAKDYLRSDAHRTAMLHDEPEPALPSTDGEREVPLPTDTPMPHGDRETLPHGYDDLTEFTEDHPELGISTETGFGLNVDSKTSSFVTSGDDVASIVAQFQHTAGAQALTGGQKEDSVDIASAARAHLAQTGAGGGTMRTALKDFSHQEQQELINEGAHGGVTARNLPDLRIDGTHYSALEAALQEKEANGEDVSDIFVM